MARLTRAEQQELTRRRILAAARSEFAERGFRAATVDEIAERAELTRGAVYSNFPGKRGLYFAVLAHAAEQAPAPSGRRSGNDIAGALGAFANTWVDGLPRTTDHRIDAESQFLSPTLSLEFVPEIMTDERLRRCFAQLITLDTLVLAATLDRYIVPQPIPGSSLRIAEAVLTILYGATQLSMAAPGAIDPSHIAALCKHTASLDPGPAHPSTPYSPRSSATDVDEPWSMPKAIDRLHNKPARSGAGIVAVLGMNRLAAIGEVLHATPEGRRLRMVIVTDTPAELAPLARLAVADLSRALRHAFPVRAIPDLQIIVDDSTTIARACGLELCSDDTELAIFTTRTRITARAEGVGACAAIAAARPDAQHHTPDADL